MNVKQRIVVGMTLMAIFTSAMAHHSFSSFDFSKSILIKGTVKEWQLTNPHTWIYVSVQKGGTVEEWHVELGSSANLFRTGLRRDSLKPGDKIELLVHPLRTGLPGGALAGVKSVNGAPPPVGLLGDLGNRPTTK